MELYIEFYIINNFILNFFINLFCVKINKENLVKIRIFLTTLIEVIISILFLYFDLDKLYIKIALLLIIPIILCKINSVKQYIKLVFVLLAVTGFIGGCIYAILIMKNVDLYKISFSYKVTVIYIIFIAFYFLLKNIIYKFDQIKRNIIFLENLELIVKDKHLKVKGYYDSGNVLYKDFKPVCIISKKVYIWLLKNNCINKIDYVNPLTVNSQSSLKVINLDEMFFTKDKKSIKNVLCAVSDNLKEYDVLIHADMR